MNESKYLLLWICCWYVQSFSQTCSYSIHLYMLPQAMPTTWCLVFEDVVPSPQAYLEELQKIPVPPPLCSAFIHPPMDEAVAAYKSRFSQAQPWIPHRGLLFLDTPSWCAEQRKRELQLESSCRDIPNTSSQMTCRPDVCSALERGNIIMCRTNFEHSS